MKKFIFLLLLLFTFYCHEKPPIDENKFMFVYIDLISFPDSLHNQPEKLEEFKQFVFNKHDIKKEDYQKMIDYYNSKPELWDEFFKKAIKYVESKPDSSFIE